MIKQRIEQVLKLNNRKSENDVYELGDLKANFRFEPELVCKQGEAEELKIFISNFSKELKQLIAINEQYSRAKQNEEKAKVSDFY